MTQRIAWYATAVALFACGGPQPGSSAGAGWHEVRFTGAALPARRSSGAAWHVTAADNSSSVLFGLLGLAVGYPDVGFALGSAMTSEPSAEAPAPFVVVKIEGETYRISPVGQTLAPAWMQPIAIPAHRHAPDARALIQVLDAVDQGVLGQLETSVGELLAPGARTLTGIGEVSSLDITVNAKPARVPFEVDLQVDPRRTLDQLAEGVDSSWAAIPVWNGDRISVRAVGKICPSGPAECFGPGGAADRWQSFNYDGFETAPHGALVAVLPGQPIVVGPSADFIAAEAGLLLLFANDTDVRNNDGGFDITVAVTPAQP